MVERLGYTGHASTERQPPLRPRKKAVQKGVEEDNPSPTTPEIPSAFAALQSKFDQTLKHFERVSASLHHAPESHHLPSEGVIYQAPPASKPCPPRSEYILSSTRKYLEGKGRVPLLPAPPAFEQVFSPYEAIFHTVFYRRYPYVRLDDAKQDGLLHVWKAWKKDMRIMDQSAAYIVQLAIWGASPHRKIEKDKRRAERELPMPRYERYIDVRVADRDRDPAWIRHIDMKVDVKAAISTVREALKSEPEGEALVAALEDIVVGRSIRAGQKRSALTTRRYSTERKVILDQLRDALSEYSPDHRA
ncbi:MAG: hypothetical protein IPK19_31260 [Chloroflexi bacterium]|nr:hypothetical protein [Chloroflexota bacterium]